MPSIKEVLAEGIETFYAWYSQHPESASGNLCTNCPVYHYLTARTGIKLEVGEAEVYDCEKKINVTLPPAFSRFILKYDRYYRQAHLAI